MRPVLIFLPGKAVFFALLAIGAVLTPLGLLPKFRKSQAFSYGWFCLAAAIFVGRVGTGTWTFWQHFSRDWDPLPVYSYGVMLCLSLIFGWYLALKLAGDEGLSKELIARCYMQTAIWAIVGARLLYVFTNWSDFEGNLLDIVKVNKGGLVAYGGFLGGFFASWIFCLRHRIPILQWADNAVPSIALGLALTRIGCFLYGCDFGARSSVPWAIRFPGPSRFAKYGSPAFEHHVRHYDLAPTAGWSFPVHPTQLYESLLGLILVVACLLVRKHRKHYGAVFATFIIGYGIPRFLLEFIRDDEQRGALAGWSTSQIIGLLTAIAGIVLYLVIRSRPPRTTAQVPLGSAVAGVKPRK